VLRGDAASRPHREPAHPPAVPVTPVMATTTATLPAPEVVAATPQSKRFILSVVDATEDDVHQVLANLPPAASYLLTPLEPET
jgi:hypothetical protein